jgi:hypothetical protein
MVFSSLAQPIAQSSTRKDFLQSALQKSKTIDLFDEDANTESPTMSQHSNKECRKFCSNMHVSRLFHIQASGIVCGVNGSNVNRKNDDDIKLAILTIWTRWRL